MNRIVVAWLLCSLALSTGIAAEAAVAAEPRASLATMAGHWHLDYDSLDLTTMPQVTEANKAMVLELVRQQIGDMRLTFADGAYTCDSPMVIMAATLAEAEEQPDAQWLHVRITAVSRLVVKGTETTLDDAALAGLPKNEYRLHDGRLYQRLQGQPLVLVFARDGETEQAPAVVP